jgi:pSer/pThr/pTyr-binding forkhead associated (FHA) protein
MVLLASIEPAASVLGSPPADLLLKIVGTARDGQIVRLTNRKCSIGSGPNCTLRLRARGVRPVHCLILRGPAGTVLRAWAPGTRVNGEIVSDAVLEPGDLVTIGPVEFEVLPPEGPPANPTDAGRTVILDRRLAEHQQEAPSPGQRSLTRQVTRSCGSSSRGESVDSLPQKRHWHSRTRKLIGEVRKLRQQIDRFQQAAPIAEQHALEVAQVREGLESIQQQNQTWEAALQRLQSELDDRQRQMDQALASLEAGRTELESERRAWQTELDAQRQAIANREAALTDAESTQQQLRENWQRDTVEREAELNATAESLTQRRHKLEQMALEAEALVARQADLDRQSQELSARSAELDQRESELAAAEREVLQAEADLANLRSSIESQRQAAGDELAAAQRELFATQAEFASARDRIAAENNLLTASRNELDNHGSRLADFEAELVAARQAIAALHESQEQRLAERTAELDRLAAELAVRELELAERLQVDSQANTDTIVAEPHAELQAELQLLRQELAARTAELVQAQAAIQQANEIAAQQSLALESMDAEARQTLAARLSQLDADHAARLEQLVQRETKLTQAEIELRDRAEQLTLRETSLLKDLATEKPSPVFDAAELAALAAQRDAVLAAEAELERERETLQADRESLRLDRETFAAERLRAAERLDAEARELAEAREHLDAERDEWAARGQAVHPRRRQDDEVNDVESGELSEFSPNRRRNPRADFGDLEPQQSFSSDTIRNRPQTEEEDSIESHIAAFMDRLRVGQPSTPPLVERTVPKRRKSDEKPPAPVSRQNESTSEVSSLSVLDVAAVPMEVARRKAPEEKSSMNILREIGLSHARSAIDTHGQRRSLNQAYTTLAISGACLIAAFFVLFMTDSAVMRSAGVAILVVGIYWMGTSIWAANKVVATIRRRRKGGLRAMLEEVDAEIAAIRKEAEAELAAAEAETTSEPVASE